MLLLRGSFIFLEVEESAVRGLMLSLLLGAAVPGLFLLLSKRKKLWGNLLLRGLHSDLLMFLLILRVITQRARQATDLACESSIWVPHPRAVK